MGVKERIITIRLTEKARDCPVSAEKLGIVVVNEFHNAKVKINQEKSDNA